MVEFALLGMNREMGMRNAILLRKTRKNAHCNPTPEERAKLPNINPQELLSFAKERRGEVSG